MALKKALASFFSKYGSTQNSSDVLPFHLFFIAFQRSREFRYLHDHYNMEFGSKTEEECRKMMGTMGFKITGTHDYWIIHGAKMILHDG